jgi:hypothetical protein
VRDEGGNIEKTAARPPALDAAPGATLAAEKR